MAVISKMRGSIVTIGDLYLTGSLRPSPTTANPYVLRLDSTNAAVSTPAGVVASPTRKKIKILIDSTVYYLLAATDWVTGNSPSISPSASRSPSASASPSAG